MAKNKKFRKEVEDAYKKELDRDIVNLNLPEIDWTTPATGYGENWDKELDDYMKNGDKEEKLKACK